MRLMYVRFFFWLNLQSMMILFPIELVKGIPGTSTYKTPPCKVEKSFIVVKETIPAGTSVLDLPTGHGEKWSLTESDVPGYLTLNVSEDADQVHITFIKSPDIEEIKERFSYRKESLPFTLECEFDGWKAKFHQQIILRDVNEHPPKFGKSSYEVAIFESSIVGSRVFGLHRLAVDPDVTGQIVDYDLEPYFGPQKDGRNSFQVSANNRYIVLTQNLDYDILSLTGSTSFGLNISATDTGDPYPLTAYVPLNITVMDVDDQSPAFRYPGCHKSNGYCKKPHYQAVIKCGYVGPLYMYPGEISAEDRDTQNHGIIYNITKVVPEKFEDKFAMSPQTGEIRVVKPSCGLRATEILITISATENSTLQHSETATVQVDLLANSARGQIPEKSLQHPAETLNIAVHGGNQEMLEPSIRDSSINLFPLITFLILFTSFTAVGALIAYAVIHMSRSKKKEKEGQDSVSGTLQDKSEVKTNKCPICQSESCQVHTDGVTCFRACSTALSCGSEMSGVELNSAVHPSAPTNENSPETLCSSSPPMPQTRRDILKTATAETDSNTVSSTGRSSNSSNRSTADRQMATKSSIKNAEVTKLPAPFVPTAITATSGYCRGGLFISCGENVDRRCDSPHYNHTNQQHRCLGIFRDGDEKARNGLSKDNCTSCTAKRHGDKEKEKKAKEEFRNNKTCQENHEEDKTVKERLKNKLNKILPTFLREENPKVRFNDRNIWAFEEETQSIIY